MISRTLTCDKRLGPYEILELAGSGGMGEVYRARDTRLSRTVAIKVLPANASQDAASGERLQREAQAISSLSHPHICSLYDVGHENGLDFLVMEYVEGETLAKRLEKGALPLTESLRCGIEILEALQHAHGRGILHCDLKPSNILLTPSGAKLMDFGIAKLHTHHLGCEQPQQEIESRLRSVAPLADGPCSEETISLAVEDAVYGTVQYMAPERLEGQLPSVSTDLFAFGAVLHEMVTGRKAFEGRDRGGIIAAILSSEPIAVSQLQPKAPATLDHVVARCLARHPTDRWETAHDVRLELQWILERGPHAATPRSTSGHWTRARASAIIVGAALLALLLVLAGRMSRSSVGEPQTMPMRFEVDPPDGNRFSTAAGGKWMDVSPDGRWLEFSAVRPDGKIQLWVRALESGTSHPLAGTENAQNGFWSADSRFIAFSVDGQLKKVDVFGGLPQTLCAIPTRLARGGTWNRDGVILFAPATHGPTNGPDSFRGGLLRVAAAGGATSVVTTLDATREETFHSWPQFLPDGRHFLYRIYSKNAANTGIYLGSLDDPARRAELVNVDSNPMYSSGYLLFGRGGTLFAQPYDLRHARLSSEPAPVVEQIVQNSGTGQLSAGASQTGILAYLEVRSQQLIQVDRSGRTLGPLGPLGVYRGFSVSPNGDQVAMSLLDPRTGLENIWVVDVATDRSRQLTFGSAHNLSPIFASDGRRLVFTSDSEGRMHMYTVLADGSSAQRINPSEGGFPTSWSRDGRFIIFDSSGLSTNSDISVIPVSGDQKPFGFLQTGFNERGGQLSPDGNWMTYQSDESGVAGSEVYVRRFPSAEGKWQISSGGGRAPKWRADGTELFYLTPEGALMAVPVRTGAEFVSGRPRVLFDTKLKGLISPPPGVNLYDVTADGQRFFFREPADGSTSAPITLVVNWPGKLHR